MRQKYQEAFSVEVDGFQGRVCQWKTQGLRGSELVKAVIGKSSVKRNWEKVIVCGKAAR